MYINILKITLYKNNPICSSFLSGMLNTQIKQMFQLLSYMFTTLHLKTNESEFHIPSKQQHINGIEIFELNLHKKCQC
jgi:hypothetical protein